MISELGWLWEGIRTGSVVALLALVIGFYVNNRKLTIEAEKNNNNAQLNLEVHRDGLTFQLLEAARREITALRVETERLRLNENHLKHFRAALDHLELVLGAGTKEERLSAEQGARIFLKKMKKLQEQNEPSRD